MKLGPLDLRLRRSRDDASQREVSSLNDQMVLLQRSDLDRDLGTPVVDVHLSERGDDDSMVRGHSANVSARVGCAGTLDDQESVRVDDHVAWEASAILGPADR